MGRLFFNQMYRIIRFGRGKNKYTSITYCTNETVSFVSVVFLLVYSTHNYLVVVPRTNILLLFHTFLFRYAG